MKMVGKVIWIAIKVYLKITVLLWMLIGMGEYLYRCMTDEHWSTWGELMEVQYRLIDHTIDGWKLWASGFKW